MISQPMVPVLSRALCARAAAGSWARVAVCSINIRVPHTTEAARASLTSHYGSVLEYHRLSLQSPEEDSIDAQSLSSSQSRLGTGLPSAPRVLDLCSSWVSHLPAGVALDVKVI
jgi:hypothetical protein